MQRNQPLVASPSDHGVEGRTRVSFCITPSGTTATLVFFLATVSEDGLTSRSHALPKLLIRGVGQKPWSAAGFPFSLMAEEKVKRYSSRLQDESFRAYLDMMALSLPRPKLATTPILVVGAADDRLISPREVETTARAYHTQAEMMTGMAHDMMVEVGWQEAADLMLDWLSKQGL
jgi:pimeloyl-ACP methyl ester carboxylesterase